MTLSIILILCCIVISYKMIISKNKLFSYIFIDAHFLHNNCYFDINTIIVTVITLIFIFYLPLSSTILTRATIQLSYLYYNGFYSLIVFFKLFTNKTQQEKKFHIYYCKYY